MPEYIDRQELIDNLNKFAPEHYNALVNQLIMKQPIADVVEVVRCKNCKYFEIDEEDELGECKCGYITVSYNGALYPHRTDFCSYGERKDNNNG